MTFWYDWRHLTMSILLSLCAACLMIIDSAYSDSECIAAISCHLLPRVHFITIPGVAYYFDFRFSMAIAGRQNSKPATNTFKSISRFHCDITTINENYFGHIFLFLLPLWAKLFCIVPLLTIFHIGLLSHIRAAWNYRRLDKVKFIFRLMLYSLSTFNGASHLE